MDVWGVRDVYDVRDVLEVLDVHEAHEAWILFPFPSAHNLDSRFCKCTDIDHDDNND